MLLMLEERHRGAATDPIIADDPIMSQGQSLGPCEAVPRAPVFRTVDVAARMSVRIELPPAMGEKFQDGLGDAVIGHSSGFRMGCSTCSTRWWSKVEQVEQ
jgi:hypothetical protein